MTKIDSTFDEFITAAAELAIKHVTEQVKTVLQAMTIYIVGPRELQYNDESHYFDGDGMNPESFFLDKVEAHKHAEEQNLKGWWMTSSWTEIDDENHRARQQVADTIAKATGVSSWDVTMQEVYDYCIATKQSPKQVMPNVYTVVELQ